MTCKGFSEYTVKYICLLFEAVSCESGVVILLIMTPTEDKCDHLRSVRPFFPHQLLIEPYIWFNDN